VSGVLIPRWETEEWTLRGSGGGSPRKYDDLLKGPSDPDVQSKQRESSTSDSAPSEARKRGSGGPRICIMSMVPYTNIDPKESNREDPPGRTITY
jgi:hypothetical protein